MQSDRGKPTQVFTKILVNTYGSIKDCRKTRLNDFLSNGNYGWL